MAQKNYAIYSLETGYIENVVLIEEESLSTLVGFPADGFGCVELADIHGEWSTCGIGWSYIDGQFVEPTQPKEPAVEQPMVNGAETL